MSLRPWFRPALAAFDFFRAWRRAACRAAGLQYGVLLAVPALWACLGAFTSPWGAAIGFLATSLFLERRPGRRLVFMASLFAAWSFHPGLPGPMSVTAAITEEGKPARLAPSRDSARTPHPAARRVEGRIRGFPTPAGKPGAGKPGEGRPGGGGLAFLLDADRGTWRILAEAPGFRPVPGQRVEVTGRIRPAEGPTNPGQLDYAFHLRAQGIAGVLHADSLRPLGPPGLFDRAVAEVRETLEAGLARTLPPAQLPMFEAALLGRTSGLDPALMEDFRASGMLHILAISGQHVGIFGLILLQICSLLRLPRKAAFVLTALVLAVYVPVCGSSISVIRSALMFWCALPGILLERPSMGMNNLAWAAFLCLLWMPGQILSLGFQLSFGATFFLILYSRPIARGLGRLRVPRPLRGAVAYGWPNLALSGILFLALLPVLSATVHTASPTSVPGNLATVGLSSAMIIAGCLALLAAPVPLLGPCLGETAGLLAASLAGIVRLLADLPGSSLSVHALPTAWSILLVLLLLVLPFALQRGRGLLVALLGLAAFSGRWACLSAADLWRAPVETVFLDVGQGDATVLRLPGAVVLIDAGPPDAGRKVIVPYLRSAGVDRLDLVVITHPDLDHYGGLGEVAEVLPIRKLVTAGDRSETKAWRDLEAILAARGVPWETARRGHTLYGYSGGLDAPLRLQVLGPGHPGHFPERNDNSVLGLLEAHGTRILFTGDMGRAAQAWLLQAPGGPGLPAAADLRGSILKVPHHGSDRTTDMAFLEALRPETAVISAGRRNRFGHPGPAALETLKRMGSRLLLTPAHGALTFRAARDGSRWETFLPEAPPDGRSGLDRRKM